MNTQSAYLQIVRWIEEQPGVVSSELLGSEIVIAHTDVLAPDAARAIVDRLIGLPVRFVRKRQKPRPAVAKLPTLGAENVS
ncbi:MAG: hypothetical protein K2R98_21275 [Gemmataceae bacterium]|nr:hypothetical protein [Gemmataceae bacterium]